MIHLVITFVEVAVCTISTRDQTIHEHGCKCPGHRCGHVTYGAKRLSGDRACPFGDDAHGIGIDQSDKKCASMLALKRSVAKTILEGVHSGLEWAIKSVRSPKLA